MAQKHTEVAVVMTQDQFRVRLQSVFRQQTTFDDFAGSPFVSKRPNSGWTFVMAYSSVE